ncbi:sodium:calcium antiporter [Caldiplasma sukawensis]
MISILPEIVGIPLIIISSFLYTNSIDYIQDILNLSDNIVGELITPLFSSFPELVIFVIAFFYFNGGNNGLSLGVIIGQPFFVLTVGMAICVFILFYIKKRGSENEMRISKSLLYPFIPVILFFPLIFLKKYTDILENYIIGIILIVSMFLYFFLIKNIEYEYEPELHEKPYLSKYLGSKNASIIQISISIVLILFGSYLFVGFVNSLSAFYNLSELTISILILPIAGVLPEILISLRWAMNGEITKSIGSLVGESPIYCTIYLGLSFIFLSTPINQTASISIILSIILSLFFIITIWKKNILGIKSILIPLAAFTIFLYFSVVFF